MNLIKCVKLMKFRQYKEILMDSYNLDLDLHSDKFKPNLFIS